MVPILVWFEPATDDASATARAKHIRSLPHAWQRRLVDTFNHDWLDLYPYRVGMPLQYINTVGEHGLIKYCELVPP
jgi:putative endonuclease